VNSSGHREAPESAANGLSGPHDVHDATRLVERAAQDVRSAEDACKLWNSWAQQVRNAGDRNHRWHGDLLLHVCPAALVGCERMSPEPRVRTCRLVTRATERLDTRMCRAGM
jgi:hypothetical protein